MNRVALITGAARRIGRGIAEHLASNGFDIAFTYHKSSADAESLCQQVRGMGRRVLAIGVDLGEPEKAVASITREFDGTFDRLDVLVHNASMYARSPLMETDLALSRRLMAIHYESPLLLTRALGPKLQEAPGHVVTMLDLLVERPWPDYLAYASSKGALWALTLALSRALAPNVTVNGIAPGVVQWPADYPQASREQYLQRVPLARAGTAQDVASLVHFLATEGRYITGQVIRLDGGRSVT